MPFVSTHLAEVHYDVDGHGDGLVLVHGTGGDSEMVFGNVVGHFTDSHTVVRPNFSGSGRTRDSGQVLTIGDVADQVAAATRAEVQGPVDLLGFSAGAMAAATVAAEKPELVRRLILVAGLTHSTSPRERLYFDTWRQLLTIDTQLFKRFTTLTGYSPAAVDRLGHDGLARSLANEWPPSDIARQIELLQDFDIRPLLPKITASTLIIGFTNDIMTPIEGSRQLHTAVRDSRLVEIEGQGHMDWLADPSRVIELIHEFLDRGEAK